MLELVAQCHFADKFITALTSVRQLSLSWASPIQSIHPHPTTWRSVLILSTHLRLSLPSGLLPSGFPRKTLYTPSPHPYGPHAQSISFFSILSPAQYWVRSTNHLAPRYTISSISPLPRRLSHITIFKVVMLRNKAPKGICLKFFLCFGPLGTHLKYARIFEEYPLCIFSANS